MEFAPQNKSGPKIIKALDERGDLSSRELIEICQLDRNTAIAALKRLRVERKIHIVDWIPPAKQGRPMAVYRVGYGINVVRPTQTTPERREYKRIWQNNRRALDKSRERLELAARSDNPNPFRVLMAQVAA